MATHYNNLDIKMTLCNNDVKCDMATLVFLFELDVRFLNFQKL